MIMGKLLYFPVAKKQKSQVEIVEDVTTALMKEVASVFIEKRIEQGSAGKWYRDIQKYLWCAPIPVDDDGNVYDHVLNRWKNYWRNEAIEYIRSRS